MLAARRLAIVLLHACAILALPVLDRSTAGLWSGLTADIRTWWDTLAVVLGAALERTSDAEAVLRDLAGTASIVATLAVGALAWLIVAPLTREHAGTDQEARAALATVTTLDAAADHAPEAPRRAA